MVATGRLASALQQQQVFGRQRKCGGQAPVVNLPSTTNRRPMRVSPAACALLLAVSGAIEESESYRVLFVFFWCVLHDDCFVPATGVAAQDSGGLDTFTIAIIVTCSIIGFLIIALLVFIVIRYCCCRQYGATLSLSSTLTIPIMPCTRIDFIRLGAKMVLTGSRPPNGVLILL